MDNTIVLFPMLVFIGHCLSVPSPHFLWCLQNITFIKTRRAFMLFFCVFNIIFNFGGIRRKLGFKINRIGICIICSIKRSTFSFSFINSQFTATLLNNEKIPDNYWRREYTNYNPVRKWKVIWQNLPYSRFWIMPLTFILILGSGWIIRPIPTSALNRMILIVMTESIIL